MIGAGRASFARQGDRRQLVTTLAPVVFLAASRVPSSVTPENYLKWETLRPTEGEYDFEQADAVVAFQDLTLSEVVETLVLDPARRLVLVRVDDEERLILLGEGRELIEPRQPGGVK